MTTSIRLLRGNELTQTAPGHWKTAWIGAGPRRATLDRMSPSQWRARVYLAGRHRMFGSEAAMDGGVRESHLLGEMQFTRQRDAVAYINSLLPA